MEGKDTDNATGINNILTPHSHISPATDKKKKKKNLSGYDLLLEERNADCLQSTPIYFNTVNCKESAGKLDSFHLCLSLHISKTNDYKSHKMSQIYMSHRRGNHKNRI